MSSMLISCTKGCGVPLEVSQEMIDLANANGVPINVFHEVCPRDVVELPTYAVTVSVTRQEPGEDKPEVLATSGGTVEAASLADAIPSLTKQLNEQWERVVQMRYVAEAQEAETDGTQK